MTNKFYAAPPREGKTYVVVNEAVGWLLREKAVYANFPIIFRQGTRLYQARVWKREYIYENITDALIIIDEAQSWYDSVETKTLPPDEDAFYATTGQNNLEIRIISQGVTRVTKAIRDRINEWVKVRKVLEIPFLRNREGKLGRPLLFVTEHFDTMEDMASKDKEKCLYKTWWWFNRLTSTAYNTHYFRNQGEKFTPPLWVDELKARGIDYERFEKKPDQGRPAGISSIANGGVLPSGQPDTVHDTDASAGPGSQPGRSKETRLGTLKVAATNLLRRVLPGPHARGQRERSPLGDGERLPSREGSPGPLDRAHGSHADGPPEGQEVDLFLPGDDQAAKNQPVQHEPGVALEGSQPGLEEAHPGIYQVGPRETRVVIPEKHRGPEVAGTDPGETTRGRKGPW